MKKLLVILTMFAAVAFTTNSAQAQQITFPDVNLAAGNLVVVQDLIDIGNINIEDVIDDITVQDVVDVTNVLNNANVQILNNVLNNLTIDNVLNNLLRDADIIKNNQVVVGVTLLGGQVIDQIFVMQQRRR